MALNFGPTPRPVSQFAMRQEHQQADPDTLTTPDEMGGPPDHPAAYEVDACHAQGVLIGQHSRIDIHLPVRRPSRPPGHREPRRVFISHTAELRKLPEPRSYVAAAADAITRAGDIVVDMAYFTAHNLPPTQVDRDRLAAADVYVLLAGFRYGTQYGNDQKSPTPNWNSKPPANWTYRGWCSCSASKPKVHSNCSGTSITVYAKKDSDNGWATAA
jgi:hypothetical protein